MRASGEDAERNRATNQLIAELSEATLAISLEAKEMFQAERYVFQNEKQV